LNITKNKKIKYVKKRRENNSLKRIIDIYILILFGITYIFLKTNQHSETKTNAKSNIILIFEVRNILINSRTLTVKYENT
jgi:hypothetical protein